MVNIIPTEYTDLVGALDNITTLLELGNKKNSAGLYGEFWVDKGIKYTSLDWNGLDGALQIDFQKSIDPESIGGPFDVISNIGFTEHVVNQVACWTNIHSLVKVGGVVVCALPYGANWSNHGFWHPDVEWFKDLATKNDYVLEECRVDYWHGNKQGQRKETRTRFRKQFDQPFVFPTAHLPRSPKPFHAEPQHD